MVTTPNKRSIRRLLRAICFHPLSLTLLSVTSIAAFFLLITFVAPSSIWQLMWPNAAEAASSKMNARCQGLMERLTSQMVVWEERYGSDLVRRSQSVKGDAAREALLLAKLLSGKPITVLAIGGSVTAAIDMPGGLASGNASYAYHLVVALNEMFPTATGGSHILVRSFLPGAGTFMHRYCAFELLRDLAPRDNVTWRRAKTADLILLDVAANDWVRLQPGMEPVPEGEKYIHAESLIRKLMSLPSRPLISFLHFGVHGPEPKSESSFLWSGEFLLDVVAARYDLLSVSFWKAYFPLVSEQDVAIFQPTTRVKKLETNSSGAVTEKLAVFQSETSGFHYKDFFLDKTHPSARGHEAAGALFTHALFSEFVDLLRRQHLLIEYEKKLKNSVLGSWLDSFDRLLDISYLRGENSTLPDDAMGGESSLPQEKLKIGLPSTLLDEKSSCGEGSMCHECTRLLFRTPSRMSTRRRRSWWTISGALTNVTRAIGGLDVAFHLGIGFKLPRPIQSEHHQRPYCSIASSWNISQNGRVKFKKGFVPRNGTYEEGENLWKLGPCGHLLPAIKCWGAQKAGVGLRVNIQLPKTRRFRKLGFVYRIRKFPRQKGAGADVMVDGEKIMELPVELEGNRLIHFWLNEGIVLKGRAEVRQVEFVPWTSFFDIVAIVAT
eukprot:TRINITY_DN20643_c0_g1_i1.p1 TRINITY_DN20643_c0_g1~~TRINITY_DN20643_c0_g1_i1.p1  ORF type:complete len:664 (+),score=39.94 TRINITY_DN20643_c0_g1_i1:2407-4398(+)